MLWNHNLDPNTNDNTNAMYIWKEILRRIYGTIQDKGHWLHRRSSEIYNSYKDLNIVDDIQWERHVMTVENERISKIFS
jgi:hypothetical protein